MGIIPNFDYLQVNEVYLESSSDYYLAKCLKISNEIFNDGTNLFYKTADFLVYTKYGRIVEKTTKKFYIN